MSKVKFRRPLRSPSVPGKPSILSIFSKWGKSAPRVNVVAPIARSSTDEIASNEQLFRTRATNASSNRWAGTIVLAAKIPMRVAGAVALILLLCIGSLLVFGEFTRKVTVKGQMVPSAGSVKVVAPQFGRITARYVVDGASVKAGQLLYVLTTARSDSMGSVDARIGLLLQERSNEIAATGLLQVQDLEQRAEGLLVRKRSVQSEIEKRREQVSLQGIQVRSSRAKQARFQALGRKGFVSPAQLADTRDEVTAQIARQKALEGDVLAVERELFALQEEVRLTGNKIRIIKSQSAQQLASLHQEAAEHQGRSNIHVLAPTAGEAAALTFQQGQSVDRGVVLATILPAGSELEAHLMVPSRAVGFIEPGQLVRLRLFSFPHQKFGHVSGVVSRVERSPISEAQAQGGPEPLYRITVKLARQSVSAYGRTQKFKAGMTLEADVLQDRRRLIEWVVDPLLSMGKSPAG